MMKVEQVKDGGDGNIFALESIEGLELIKQFEIVLYGT